MDIIFEIDDPFGENVETGRLEQAAQITLRLFQQTPVSTLMVVVTDNETSQQLNRQYRGIDAPTDVLSFENIADPDFPGMDTDHLGDIIIAYPVAQVQAWAAGHSPHAELILLMVHGLLHLLGFDHDTSENKEKMWAAQQQIMTELGLAHVHPTET